MNKIETDFEKLNHYQDIETYYPPLDDIKDFLYELFGDRVESQKYIVRTNQKLKQIQSNWNSLREWLKEQIKDTVKFKNALGYSHEDKHFQKILDKMNELEGKDNNGK